MFRLLHGVTHVEGKMVYNRMPLNDDLIGEMDREGSLKEEGVVY